MRSPIDRRLACFPFLAVVQNVAINVGVQISVQVSAFTSLELIPRGEIAGP